MNQSTAAQHTSVRIEAFSQKQTNRGLSYSFDAQPEELGLQPVFSVFAKCKGIPMDQEGV
jgi:hypothetical protein